MDLNLSYGVAIHSDYSAMNQMLNNLCECNTSALAFFADVIEKEWTRFVGVTTLDATNRCESLSHVTDDHPNPKYYFDDAFPNFPSYLRRAAISSAYGKMNSYHSNLDNWKSSNNQKRPPSMPTFTDETPFLYYNNMFKFCDSKGKAITDGSLSEYAKIKVFCNQRQLLQDHAYPKKVKSKINKGKLDPTKCVWDWIIVRLKKSDINYLRRKRKEGYTIGAPKLTRKGSSFELRFSLSGKSKLSEAKPMDRLILSVDLGINTPATCCVMRSDGTILARRFAPVTRDMGLLEHRAHMISRAQRHGSRKTPVLWRMADNINDKISRDTASFIMKAATEFSVDVIVFEHLDFKGKKHGTKKQRLHLWRSQYVQELVGYKAHALGMRIARVCAWNTSRLAYDGSGRVKRGEDAGLDSYSLCKFASGKVYNCDLNAAYNIGARYFIRELSKTKSAKVWSELGAKIPELMKRSTCTLSTLISLCAVLVPSGSEKARLASSDARRAA